MASQAVAPIPGFLLPRYPQMSRVLERTARRQLLLVRFASSTNQAPQKPIVLEKPVRFNPPSHGSRLPKRSVTPRHYGGELSKDEVKAQERKEYPGTMAPTGTWAYWFWNSRGLHLFISLGTLASLAVFTFVENFWHTSPYADLLPSPSDFLYQPFGSLSTTIEVFKLTEMHKAAVVQEKRSRRVDDVVKRKEYRKAHGLEEPIAFPWLVVQEDKAMPAPSPAPSANAGHVEEEDAVPDNQSPRKKWLGLF